MFTWPKLTVRILCSGFCFVTASASHNTGSSLFEAVSFDAHSCQPPARWKHAAVALSSTELMVFGGNIDNSQRLNDVWIFDVVQRSWAQPQATLSTTVHSVKSFHKHGNNKEEPLLSGMGVADETYFEDFNVDARMVRVGMDTSDTAPAPRSGHTLCVCNGAVYLFGGFGGGHFQRKAFNDVHMFNMESYEWKKVATVGDNRPDGRSGHICQPFGTRLLVGGGWNSKQTFEDIWVLDVVLGSWERVSASLGWARWDCCAALVPAVPHPQIFIFGGSAERVGNDAQDDDEGDSGNQTMYPSGPSGFVPPTPSASSAVARSNGTYMQDVLVLDTGSLAVKAVKIEVGAPPRARADSVSVYVPATRSLFISGGWANRWLSDAAWLNVAILAGPPYAVSSCTPKLGPITGGNHLAIEGIGFYAGQTVNARFVSADGKRFKDVTGLGTSEGGFEVDSPDFVDIGPGKVEVRAFVPGNTLSITSTTFEFFNVTKASNCVAFGPGLQSGSSSAMELTCTIQAIDRAGMWRTTGGDEFTVCVFQGGALEYSAAKVAEAKGKPSEALDAIVPTVTDNDNGTYLLAYTVQEPGEYTIDIAFMGSFGGDAGQIGEMPRQIVLVDSGDAELNDHAGPNALESIKDDIRESNTFARATLDGLNRKVPADSLDTLLSVKNHLTDVSTFAERERLRTARVNAHLHFLRRGSSLKEKEIEKLQKACDIGSDTWIAAQKQAPICKVAIAPLVKQHGTATRNEIETFAEKTAKYQRSVARCSFWDIETGQMSAETAMKEAREVHNVHVKVLSRMSHLATTFDYPHLVNDAKKVTSEIEEDTQIAFDLWSQVEAAQEYIDMQKSLLWLDLNTEDMEDGGKTLLRTMKDTANKRTRSSQLYKGLQKSLQDFLLTCPLMSMLKHPSMRPRHWDLLMKATDKVFKPPHEDEQMTLKSLLDLNLHEYKESVEEISDQAMKEEKMEGTLAKLSEFWSGVEFVEEEYQQGSDIKLLRMAEEDFEALENDQLVVQGMASSRFVQTFFEQIMGWKQELANVSDVMMVLTEIQRTWSYLEPLFIGSDEVKKELPEEAVKFQDVDCNVKEILRAAASTKNVKGACNRSGLLKRLEDMKEVLDSCQKALDDFLAAKRVVFPRFYFVSNADLLDILSNGSQPHKIMKHITKVFLATATLTLQDVPGSDRPVATRWDTCMGTEDCAFAEPPRLEGKPEKYLQTILEAKCGTLRLMYEASKTRLAKQDRIEWLMHRRSYDTEAEDAAQIGLLLAGTQYVLQTEAAFDKLEAGDSTAMQQHHKLVVSQLQDLIKLTRTKISKADRRRVMNMITMDAHSRDVVHKLIADDVKEKRAFQWQSQLKQRYEDGEACIRVADAKFPYMYEYLGNGGRLVITPLTDRIYVTATQALNLCMGCAPAGPAGTGKTESTKDLSSALGIVCYVVNCSPEMDYRTLGNIFKGLAASGSWGCFDEFNRLVPAVLSVCSVQFKAVCDGIRSRRKDVTIEGETVSLVWSAGAFITMNPGYLGRSELPEGLKALFRPITVMVPDLVLICENMLMAEGFEEAKVLASKFYGLYSLLRELLSKQLHYDWGLRAVKSVLVVAGGFKRAEPDLPEQELLMRALRDFNTPKIVQQDEEVFFGLLGDLFPNMDPPRKINETLEAAVTAACEEMGLDADDTFRLKVVQLEELIAIRHCTFVMGPPAAGKSTCWKTLAKARGQLGHKTKFVDLNPKAVSPAELYGYVHPATREWKDGLLSCIMRDLGNEPNSNPKWIILDGDLDANWIESMNSVMDDNKMLTLASNERIPLKENMRMLFEIRDLVYASPATVSRAGILYISTDSGSQWRSLIASWLKQVEGLPESALQILRCLFDAYCPDSLLFIKKTCKPLVQTFDTSLIENLLRILNVLLTSTIKQKLAGISSTEEQKLFLESYMVFACIWAFGSSLTEKDNEDYRVKFSEWWKGAFRNVRMPSRETVFDYYMDPEDLHFEKWEDSPLFRTIEFDSQKQQMSSITVPTPQSVSVDFFLGLLVAGGYPAMLVGSAGCGKTQLVSGLLQRQNPEERAFQAVNFNFFTDADNLQVSLEAPLEKKTGTNYGPPGFGKLVYFVDDLNLPEVDPYNTQSAISLVRQHLDYGHWYDKSKLLAKSITSTQYVAAMNPTAGSFLVNPRLQRHFFTFAIGFPGPSSLYTIYNTFLQGHLQHFTDDVQEVSGNVLNAALQLHTAVAATFRKSARNFHYEFNIRHLSNVFQGLLMAEPDQFSSPAKLVSLWLHESERVYGDRLVSRTDLTKYQQLAFAQAKKRLGDFTNVFANFFAASNPMPLIFCHFSESIEEKCYNQVEKLDTLQIILTDALKDYNETNATMDLVLFEDAMRHVCRIARIINNPSGHALLVGVGGSGKQSLARLASFICGYRVSSIVISGTYSMNDFRDDLKGMYRIAGVKDEGVSFLFTDSQIAQERFLVLMNDLLASGNIPDLFAEDEKDEISNSLVSKVKAAGIVPDSKACWNYFLNNVRKNLHVILCFSPVGEDFRTRAKRFPALVSCTVIDWFQPWPEQALHSVGESFLRKIPDLGSDDVRTGIASFLPFSFKEVNAAAEKFLAVERRYVYTTPKSFLELLKLYETLLERKRQEYDAAISRLENGLLKMQETADSVEAIEADLKVSLADAEVKKAEAEGIATTVAANKAVVEEETAKANIIAEEAAAIAASAQSTQAEADGQLAAAEPAVAAAVAALETLNEKDLSSCKTMQQPPPGVDDVFYAVMVLLAKVEGSNVAVPTSKAGKVADKHRTWGDSKKALLSDVKGLLGELLTYKEKIENGMVPSINFKEVRQYLALEHFNRETLLMKNSAAAGLCEWCVNIVKFRDIFVTVEPLREALAAANAEYTAASEKLAGAQKLVAELSSELAELEVKYGAALESKQAAEMLVENGQKRLSLANRLTAALATENVRWGQSVERMKIDKELLIGDVLLAAAFVSYIGPFTKVFRQNLVSKSWLPFLESAAGGKRVPMSATPNPLLIMTDEAEKALWRSQELPDDAVSVENAAIVKNTERWPLIIDPQLQGIVWIRNREADHSLQVTRLTNKNMLHTLEVALESGTPVLIENMGESVDAVLNPVIQRSTIKRGTRRYLKLGDKELEFNPAFRLYMHTKLSNPHYPPEIQAEAALVNFTVTEDGLEDQLLAMTVGREREDLASTKNKLIVQQNQFKIKMKELEDGILQKLAEAQGDITEDVGLIESLEDTKRVASDIEIKAKIAQETESTINETSEKYRPVARRASLLFFLMNSLFKVHSYYVYSLASFVSVFMRSIDLVSGDLDPMKGDFDADGQTDGSVGPGSDAASTASAGEADATDGDDSDSASDSGSSLASSTTHDSSSTHSTANQDTDLKIRAGLTDEQLVRRCGILKDSITQNTFEYVNRGLFVRDKLMFATYLCFSIMADADELRDQLVNALIVGLISTDAGSSGQLSEWLPGSLWPRVQGLETLKPQFESLGDDMLAESEKWQRWFDNEKPENLKPPGEYKKLDEFYKLLLLRALRPDRLPAALQAFVSDKMGESYVIQQPFNTKKCFDESSPSVPVFFVLFPGVDPTVDVEELGQTMHITAELGKFENISMGQGQDKRAMTSLDRFAASGGWLMLQNVHLMQGWLPSLERKLESVADGAHPDFRCFISAEPPPFSYMKNMPESLMQGAIKVANEAPADLKSNLLRAWACFDEHRISESKKPNAFKACLFTLCWYHAVVLGRRRFGQQGWSKAYSFNKGDLTVCADVLQLYINNNADAVPWQDLRYIFGEIMYGGHITDSWDRRTNNTYLQVYLQEGCMEEFELAPGFKAPKVQELNYDDIEQHILSALPKEAPPMFGLHPNAEIGYLTSYGTSIFSSVLSLRGGTGTGGTGGGDSAGGLSATIKDLLDRLPENFIMLDVQATAEPILKEKTAPYALVAVQECTRMNVLLSFIRSTLVELQKGLAGQLNMTEAMEDLVEALSINQVPGRNPFHKTSWDAKAWPSRKSLPTWFQDLLQRFAQLSRWVQAMETPKSLWLSGLFNPMAFLTAIMQVVARGTGLPLDSMAIDTHITTMSDPSDVQDYPPQGMFAHGLFIEGARWGFQEIDGSPVLPYVEDGVTCGGHLTEARLKELQQSVPVVYLKGVEVDSSWDPSSYVFRLSRSHCLQIHIHFHRVGYLRRNPAIYDCPLYVVSCAALGHEPHSTLQCLQTTFRGPTYISNFTLRSSDPTSKWILAGVALVMQLDA